MVKPIFPASSICLKKSCIPNAGRGVFASENIHQGDLIELCPVIVIPPEQTEILKTTNLRNYYFLWGKEQNSVAIALGLGSLYNHSYTPNATYVKKTQEACVEFIALQDIPKGDEITVNYNFGDPTDTTTLWIPEIPPAKT